MRKCTLCHNCRVGGSPGQIVRCVDVLAFNVVFLHNFLKTHWSTHWLHRKLFRLRLFRRELLTRKIKQNISLKNIDVFTEGIVYFYAKEEEVALFSGRKFDFTLDLFWHVYFM